METPQGFVDVAGIGAMAPGRRADAEQPEQSPLHCSGAFLTWLLYCTTTLIIFAIILSLALSIIGTLKKGPYRKGELL